MTELNSDFAERACVHGAALDWQPSPMTGVDRRMIERIGGEVARATSIVRYAPDSHFSPHVHTGGEEFIVLDGVFQDEHGDFPAGSYVRNPPGSRHTPGSDAGCVIFVKLWQMEITDRTPVAVDTTSGTYAPETPGDHVHVLPLHDDGRETVRMEKWDAGAVVSFMPDGGLELFVLDGSLAENSDTLERHSWLRVPAGTRVEAVAGTDGAHVWIKEGHLAHMAREAFATETAR